MKIEVYRPDGTFYEVDDPGVVVPENVEVEPTAEEILNAMLGVTSNE